VEKSSEETYLQTWYALNRDRKLEYQRIYGALHRERKRKYDQIYSAKQYSENPEKHISTSRTWNNNNPEKRQAADQARYYIPIPKEQVCEGCHLSLATQRHHPDYTKPLEVKFLCRSCHMNGHRNDKQKMS
jgi:hypothetical protein